MSLGSKSFREYDYCVAAWLQNQGWWIYMAIYTYMGAPNQSVHVSNYTLTYLKVDTLSALVYGLL